MMVSVGNVPPWRMKRYLLPLLNFKFLSRVNIEQHECWVNFWDFSGFAWTFLYINWVSYAFMCIIQIWTTRTCSSAYKLVEKFKYVSLVAFLIRSHARNGNEIQTSGRRGSAGNIKKLGFLILVNPTRMKIMKLGLVSWHGEGNMP